MPKPRKSRKGYVEDLEPTFAERVVAPPLVIKVRRWLQAEYAQLVPVEECYERVCRRIFDEGLELEVLSHVRSDFYQEALRTSPRAVFERFGARELLWGFWKPEKGRDR